MRVLSHRIGWFALFVGLALVLAATLTIWGSLEAQDGTAVTGDIALYARRAEFSMLTTSVPWMISFVVLVIVFIALIAAGIRDTIHSMLELDPWDGTEESGPDGDPHAHPPPGQLH